MTWVNGQTLEWLQTGGGTLPDKATDIVVDNDGFIYITGFYNEAATFGSINIPFSNPSSKEVFVAKLDPQGNYVWVKTGENYYDDRGLGMCLDPQGNVYVTGTCWGGMTFGTLSVYNPTYYTDQIFVLKLDNNGNEIWMKNAGCNQTGSWYSDDHGMDVVSDSQGNIYVTGLISNNDYAVQNAYFDAIAIPVNVGDTLAFLGKLTNNGVWQWVESFNAVDAQRDLRIDVDNEDNVYVCGAFSGTQTFGPDVLTSAGGTDIFVIKYDPSGNYLMSATAGSELDDRANDITFDQSNSMIVTGEFRSSCVFGSLTLNNYGSGPSSRDIFVAKLSKNGTWLWATKAGSKKGTERGNSVAVNDQGNIFVTGQIRDQAKFGSAIVLESDPDSVQVFVASIDTNGFWKWARNGGGPSYDRGNGIACDNDCNVYATGYYQYQANFEGQTLTSLAGSKDIFILKYADACSGNNSGGGGETPEPTICDLPMPNVFSPNADFTNDVLYFTGGCTSDFYAVVVNRWGEVVFQTKDSYQGWDGTDMSGIPVVEGTYFYRIRTMGTEGVEIEVHGFLTVVR